MYQAQEIIIPLAAFAMVFGIVYLAITSTNRKELAMIEAGMNPNKSEKRHSKIRFGLLAIKNVGFNIAKTIIKERKDNGPYKNLQKNIAICIAKL